MAYIPLVNIFLSTACLLLVVNVMEVKCLQTKVCSVQDPKHPRGVCQPELTDVVMTLCERFGNRVKRDTAAEKANPFNGLTLDKQHAMSYLTKRESRSDIVCECCVNTCTVQEMLDYC